MSRYANKTSVSIDRSMGQIRQLLSKRGADGVAIAETKLGGVIQFIYEKRPYKFSIYYPSYSDDFIRFTNTGRERSESQMDNEIETEKRRLWRCLVLYIKAAIEAHENGLISLKKSLMSHLVLNSGETVYEKLENNVDKIESNPNFLLN